MCYTAFISALFRLSFLSTVSQSFGFPTGAVTPLSLSLVVGVLGFSSALLSHATPLITTASETRRFLFSLSCLPIIPTFAAVVPLPCDPLLPFVVAVAVVVS